MRQLKGQAAEQAELELGPAALDGQALAEAEESSAGELESGAAADGLADMLAGSTAGFSLAPGDSATSRYLGMTLFYPALQAVGLLEMAAQVYQLAGALRFGVQQVFFELFCLALLQESTVERVKRLLRSDLGAVIGCPRAACVKTLRRKLQALSERRPAARLGLLLARHWLEAGLLNSSFLYVDGHVKVYSGSRLVPEVWNSQRRMPLPGHRGVLRERSAWPSPAGCQRRGARQSRQEPAQCHRGRAPGGG